MTKWADAAGEAAEASNLNDLETRIKAAVGSFSQHTWTQKTASVPLSAANLNSLEQRSRGGINLWQDQASPGSVTDWGSIINTHISNGVRTLFFETNRVFPFTTQIELATKRGVNFVGETSAVGTNQSLTNRAVLLWKNGSGSGIALYIHNGSSGCKFEDVSIVYDHAAYDGGFIRVDSVGGRQNSKVEFRRCRLGAQFEASWYLTDPPPAAYVLSARDMVLGGVYDCQIAGAAVGIKGYDTDSNDHPDDLTVRDNQFENCVSAALMNVGRYWDIGNNDFYMGGFDTPNPVPYIIDSDHTATSLSRRAQFSFHHNRVWDKTAAGAGNLILFRQNTKDIWDADFHRNWVFGSQKIQEFELGCTGSVRITDNEFERPFANTDPPFIDGGSPVTARKDLLVITGNTWGAGAASVMSQTVVNTSGHKATVVENNGPTSKNVRPVTREYAHCYFGTAGTDQGLTVSNQHANASVTRTDCNDTAGTIVVTLSSTGVPANTKIADFAFPFTDAWPDMPFSPSTRQKPAVVVESIRITGVATAVGDAVPEVADNSVAGFALYTKGTALTAGNYAWVFRMTMML